MAPREANRPVSAVPIQGAAKRSPSAAYRSAPAAKHRAMAMAAADSCVIAVR